MNNNTNYMHVCIFSHCTKCEWKGCGYCQAKIEFTTTKVEFTTTQTIPFSVSIISEHFCPKCGAPIIIENENPLYTTYTTHTTYIN
jgi:hypothetical protein